MELVEFYKPEVKEEEAWAERVFEEFYDKATGRYRGLIKLPREYEYYYGSGFLVFGREGGNSWTAGGVIECWRAPLPPEKLAVHGIPSLNVFPIPHNPKELYLVKLTHAFNLYLVPFWDHEEIGIHDGKSGEVSLGSFRSLETKIKQYEASVKLCELKRKRGIMGQGIDLKDIAEKQRLLGEACCVGGKEWDERIERCCIRMQEIIDAGNYLIHFFPDDSIHFEERGNRNDFELLGQAGLG